MTFKIRRKKLRLSLAVPAPLVVFWLSKKVRDKIDKRTKREMKRKLKQAKKDFGRLVLIDVQATDGTKVKITL